jgi:hypothetical protein
MTLESRRGLLLFPLHERAIAEGDCAVSGDFGYLVARAPESAVGDANRAFVCRLHFDHGGILSMKRSKLRVGNQQGIWRTLFHEERDPECQEPVCQGRSQYC